MQHLDLTEKELHNFLSNGAEKFVFDLFRLSEKEQDVWQKIVVRERAKHYQYMDSVSADERGGFEGMGVKKWS